jgi:hypothetical protein
MLAEELGEFLRAGVRDGATLPAEIFRRLDDRLGHALMGLLGATHQRKAFASRDTFLLVGGVQA